MVALARPAGDQVLVREAEVRMGAGGSGRCCRGLLSLFLQVHSLLSNSLSMHCSGLTARLPALPNAQTVVLTHLPRVHLAGL